MYMYIYINILLGPKREEKYFEICRSAKKYAFICSYIRVYL